VAWLTPDRESGTVYRSLAIPNTFLAEVNGALNELCYEHNWEQFSALTPEECADRMNIMMDMYFESNQMIGTFACYATKICPANLLPCDGSSYQREDYPELYAVLDDQYIDSEDKFHVPLVDNRYIKCGAGDLGAVGGEETHVLTTDEMPPHTHPIPDGATFPYGEIPEVTVTGGLLISTTGSAGGGMAHNNDPKFIKFPIGIVWR
jgi:hypothetical protein